jgi:outer membrane receptor protein involved in Fe transport
VVSGRDNSPLEYATLTLTNSEAWSVTDQHGGFRFNNLRRGNYTITVQVLGFETKKVDIVVNKSITNMVITLQEQSLKLDEVVVTAQKRASTNATAYSIDRTTLDHTQALNITDISSLLPGGKFRGDLNLASSDVRFALRAGTSESGNASFGTAVEVDGVRLDNNAQFDETKGADTRSVNLSNVEGVEIVTGIPSVEYGDLTNGIVKVKTKHGKTPFTVEMSARPNTKQVALNKGFRLGEHGGLLNVGAERTKSISDIASPYTSYDRNALTLNYSQTFNKKNNRPVNLNVSAAGNIGGYNSEADPDAFSNTYTKQQDNNVRAGVELNWAANLKWLSKLEFSTSVNYANKQTKTNTNKSSSSSQPSLHGTQEGYYITEEYDGTGNQDAVLLEPGYWYQLAYYDNRPISYRAKLKGDWGRQFGEQLYNRVLLGAEMSSTGNLGRGTYYDDMRYAPTWREYDLSKQSFMNNYSIFLEEKADVKLKNGGSIDVMAGVRYDITSIRNSEYGTNGNFSPRLNVKYNILKGRDAAVSDLNVYAGWGRSVKLPSFAVLYPTPSYSDRLAFASTSDASGKAFYAYHTSPSGTLYNPDLKWQSSDQIEVGTEFKIWGTRISLSAFHSMTRNPYVSTTLYTPFSYKLTSQSFLESCSIPTSRRIFSIDSQTGVVTVSDAGGELPSQTLGYNVRNAYKSNTVYANGSDVKRWGIEYVVDFARIEAIKTSIRLDGNFYRYRGAEQTMMAYTPASTVTMSNGDPYQYVGYYVGGASSSNGSLTKQLNTNLTITTHIPKLRLIVSLRTEASFINSTRYLSESSTGDRGLILSSSTDNFGTTGDIYSGDHYVAYYPEYYTTWENPDVKIPFAEKFLWAKDNDRVLYADLAKLVVRSNNPYFFKNRSVSPYFNMNLNVSKEIGKLATITLFATNFFNNMSRVNISWNDTETSLYNSSYIPKFYYGASLRLKL